MVIGSGRQGAHLGAAGATSAATFERVQRLGADVVIDYQTQDF